MLFDIYSMYRTNPKVNSFSSNDPQLGIKQWKRSLSNLKENKRKPTSDIWPIELGGKTLASLRVD